MNGTRKILILICMILNTFISCLLFFIFERDIIISISILVNLFFSFYMASIYAPDNYKLKLSTVYLLGFSLFICGRFISNIFGVSQTFCFDFDYIYCLSSEEKIRSNILISLSMVFFIFGFVFKSSASNLKQQIKTEYVNYLSLNLLLLIGILLGLLNIYFQSLNVIKAIQLGYMALYESQSEVYQPPLYLVVNLAFYAITSIIYAFKDFTKPIYFKLILILFMLPLLFSILTGGRTGFISAILISLWLYLGEQKINLRKIGVIVAMVVIIAMTNTIASLSGARVAGSLESKSLFDKLIIDIFYNQGLSMMVFNLGTLHNEYPLFIYLKTLFPGVQILFSDIKPYEISFSVNLTYKLAPTVFYNNMGWGWSLLGDFYAFSFGVLILFYMYNFIWGRLLFNISKLSYKSTYYKGVYFCFMISIFSINRASISPLIFTLIVYTILYYLLKISLGDK